jgi:mevalonate kinase
VSPTAALSSTKRAEFSIPGKIFLLGEYAVLSGGSALIAAIGPRFRLKAGGAAPAFHPQSPAGKLLGATREFKSRGFAFSDPHEGEGGFGASTAQFALVYGALAEETGWDLTPQAVRRVYRELLIEGSAEQALPPSGADLIAQLSGGVVKFDAARETIVTHTQSADWRQLLVFSAAAQPGRKVPTHEHLERLGSLGATLIASLGALVDQAEQALLKRDSAAFGRALVEYADVLSSQGLELDQARADRLALCALPGVLGAKGTGALLADTLIAWLDPAANTGTETRGRVIKAAQARGLKLIADGLKPEPGWLCEQA